MKSKGSILVVDDTLASLKLLTEILTAEGYEIHPADSGELALASVASNPPEVILLDIRMPGMDGFEVCRGLKARPESREIPVLFISATTDQAERVEGLRLGAVDFIAKPFQREDLLARVAIHLELARLRTQLESQVAQRTAELNLANEQLQHELDERKRVEQTLIRLNRELRAVSLCNETLVRAVDEQTLLNDICRIVCEEAGYRMAWVGFAEHDELKTVRPAAWSGFENRYLSDIHISWADTEYGRGPTGTCIRTGQSRYNQDFATNLEVAPWRDAALERGYHSTIALPLMAAGCRPFGSLTVYAAEVDAFTPDEIRLLEELASDLAYGIISLRGRAERKRAEKALAESRQHTAFLAALLERSSQPFVVGYPDGRLSMFNDAFSQLVGYSREELISTTWSSGLTPPEWREAERAALEQLHRTGEPVHYEKEYVRKNGVRVPVALFVDLIKEEQGRRECYCAFVTNITERKRMEEGLKAAKLSAERAKEAAEDASRAKDRFLAILSHELRTPLTPIMALTSALSEDESLGGALHKDMQTIQRNVELEARLIDDLLDVTRIVHGKVKLDKHPVDLSEIIRRVVEICWEDIKVRRIHFGVTTEGEPYPILADAARLQQVFWNLLKNALKFTSKDGCISIECRRVGQSVVAEVKDSGKGIAAEDLGRIFNPFEQIERQESSAYGGLGLGLTLSKSLVELHGGTIEAKSEGLGLGATLCVTLPLAETVVPVVASPAVPSAPASLRVLQILLVEDHGDTARILSRLLRNQGHEVRTAGDLKTALKLSREWEFDLLISDLGLPDGNGRDLMSQLRFIRPTIPGIAISGFGTEEDIHLSQEAGFEEHLVKPVSIPALRAAIQRITSRAA